MLYRLAFFFVLVTGFTGLVYQVTWHKYLSFYLGSQAMAAALVLAVFFLFLSLGYSVFGRNIHRIPIRNKLFVYGIIEALIGFYALLSPEIFHGLTTLMPAGGQSQASDFLLGFAFAAVFIGLPTFLMGTTIPVLTQALSRDFDSSHSTHAAVYGLNTLGAVFGALLTGFVLIDIWGLPLTLLNTGVLNIAIGFATWLIWKARPEGFSGIQPQDAADTPGAVQKVGADSVVLESDEVQPGAREPTTAWVALLYWVSFASGFYVFSLENLMIRLAGLIIGSSNYTFAMIVAAFILGIALGSLWVGRRRISSPKFFLWVQMALLASAIALYLLVPVLPEWLARVRVIFAPSYMNISLYWTAVFVVFTALLLVPVALMGMNLPLIFNYLRSRGLFLSQTVGRIYAVNTMGSVLGSLVGGYLLFFVLNWDGVYRFNLILIALTLPLILLLTGLRRWPSLGASVAAIVAVLLLPRWDDTAFLPSPAMISQPPPTATSLQPRLDRLRSQAELEFAYHGPAAHVGVIRVDGAPQLHINGNPNTARGDWELRAMNAIYPLSLVPEAEKAFVVGLGGGLSTSLFAETPSMEKVVVSEIAIGAIEALPYFDEQNADFTTQPYYDKVEFVAADALKVLRSTDEQFDVIVSEPNHPWVAGVENLFSVEFLTEVRERLSEGGVYCQWFPLFVAEPNTVLTILNTFRAVFPEIRVFSTGGATLSIVAGNQPFQVDGEHIERVIDTFRHRLEPRDSDFANPMFVLATEVLNEWSVSSIVKDFEATHTFEFPVVASAAFRAKFAGVGTNFPDAIADRLHTVADKGEPGGAILYEQLRGRLDAQFFDEAYRPLARRGGPTSVSLARLWYHRTTWFDSEPDWPQAEDRAVLEYVSGVNDEFPQHLREAPDNAERERREEVTDEISEVAITGLLGGSAPPSNKTTDDEPAHRGLLNAAWKLFNVYRELVRAQVPANLDRVIDAVPRECDSPRCAHLKRAILVTALGRGEAAGEIEALDPKDEQERGRIHSLFAELRVR